MSNFFKARFLEHELTPNQISVGLLVLDGKNSKEIANKLNVSLSTVKMHLGHIYLAIGYSSRNKFITDFYKAYLIHHGVIVHLSKGIK
jgi:DNA-binding CsgD family transcriptional regulator